MQGPGFIHQPHGTDSVINTGDNTVEGQSYKYSTSTVIYLQTGDRIVIIDYVTSLHRKQFSCSNSANRDRGGGETDRRRGGAATYSDVRVSGVARAELAAAALLLAVLEELGSAQNGDEFAAVAQRERRDAVEAPMVGGADRQHDRHRLVGRAAVEQAAEVLALQELALAHESRERRRPALARGLTDVHTLSCPAVAQPTSGIDRRPYTLLSSRRPAQVRA